MTFDLVYLPARNNKQSLASIVLFVMLINLIVGGIILPYRQAQAVVDIIGGPSGIIRTIYGYVKGALDEVAFAYNAAANWISAAMEEYQWLADVAKEAAKVAWNVLRKQLLNMLVNDIVKWIQNGTTPRFVTDWQGFLNTAGDTAAGNFVTQYLGAGFLCDTFDFKLKIALSKPQTFDEGAIKCTLSKITSNINNFFNNFSNGGWAGWLEVSETQNNIMGATLMVLDQKYDVMAKAQEAAKNEVVSAAGFEGDKVCSQRQCLNSNGQPGAIETYSGSSLGWKTEELSAGGFSCSCLKWEIRTPGRVAGDALQQAAGVDIQNLIQAKEFAEYAAAIIDAVINRVIKEGVAAMKTGSSSSGASGPGITTSEPPVINISPYSDAFSGQNKAKTLNEQQLVLVENTEKAIAEYKTSLGILNNIKNSQINTLNNLKDIVQGNCATPSSIAISAIPNTQKTTSDCSVKNNTRECPCVDTLTEQIKLTIPGTGEGVFLKTTTLQYRENFEFISCELNQTIITYENISYTAAVESDITIVNNEITSLQDKIIKIDTAYRDTLSYVNAAQNYVTLYDLWQNSGGLDKTIATSTAEIITKDTKAKAIVSNQTALSSSSTDFGALMKEVMKKSQDTANTYGDIMTRRGAISDCAYAQPATYLKDLCDAQVVESAYANARNSCLGVDF